ncbi:MAG: UvrD-helicase domain-containing protein [Rhodospirillales bacterium]
MSKEEGAARAAGLPSGNLRAEAFMKVFNPIFEEYQNRLSARGEIDFQDMIIKAAEHVKTGLYPNPYSYILVDEFQDTSPDRVRLLKALLKSSPGAQLFAVGDDWQSIYRFAGSDTAVMREFSGQFGVSERMDLSRTFRCADEIAAVATKFVLSNPHQLRKQVSGVKAGKRCISIGLPETKYQDLLSEALEKIERMHPPGERASVLVLGRYNRSKPFNIAALANAHARFDISFMTVHKSKGLEADYVVVTGLCSGKDAFPSEIEDDPILNMVLSTPEKHQNAEERRLFYVAITRAKHHVFLLADEGPPSVFVQELLDGDYEANVFGRKTEDDVPCPACPEGILTRRPGK